MANKGSREVVEHCKEEFLLVPPGFDPLPSAAPIITDFTNETTDHEVTARWRPEGSCRPELEDAPVFCPSDEVEFEDPLKYISDIRTEAENYGICRVIPPSSWRPPNLLEDEKTWQLAKFTTRVQQLKRLSSLHVDEKEPSWIGKMETEKLHVPESRKEGLAENGEDRSVCSNFGFEYGPEFSLNEFSRYADDFKSQYFGENDSVMRSEPSTPDIEGEYWRIIENPSDNIEVLYGSNLGHGTLESGFPTTSNPLSAAEHSKYVDSGWNSNNVSKLPGSLLSFGCVNTTEILHPQLFIGMCFASQCWRSEEHHLYSLSYMHLGSPTVWYGVPGRYYFKFVELLKKRFPESSRQPKLLQYLVAQITPSAIIAEGIPLYRCVQNPSEFVLVFPGAYNSRFSCGFSCIESAYFAPIDWLPHGHNMIELYSAYRFKTTISHDKLLLGAAIEAVNASNDEPWRGIIGKDGILTKLLKGRVKLEAMRREHLCNPRKVTVLDEFDPSGKVECSVCFYDLYLSAVRCPCSTNKHSCLLHAKQLCSCAWSEKLFVFRFKIDELNLLVEALEGDGEAIRFWAKRKGRASNDDDGHNARKHTTPPDDVVIVLSDDEN